MSTSAVTISINVADNSSAALGKVETSVKSLGAAGTAANAQMAGVAAGLDEVGAAGTRMAGSYRDATRTVVGAAHEMGIGVSRYFASEITEQFPGLIGMVKSLGTAFLALGAIEIGAHLVGELSAVYEKLFDVDKAIDDYHKKAATAAQDKLFDIASIETTVALLAQANRQVDDLAAKKKAAGAEGKMGGLTQYGRANPEATGNMMVTDFDPYTTQDAEKQAQNLLQAQKAAEKQGTLQHEQNLAQIKLEQNNSLQGYAKRADEERAANKLSAEGVRYQQEQEGWLQQQIIAYQQLLMAQGKYVEAAKLQIPSIAGDSVYNDVGNRTKNTAAGREQQVQQDAEAAKRKSEGDAEAARRERDQEIAMHNEAVDAGLRGEALYQAQREQAIASIERKFGESEIRKQTMQAETADINLKFDNAKLKRMEAEQEQIQKMAREADAAGLTGLAKIQADTENRQMDIIAAARASGKWTVGGDNSSVLAQVGIEGQKGSQQSAEASRQYYARLQQMNDEWNASQLQGYARIEAETIRHLDTVQKDFERENGGNIADDQLTQSTITNAWANADRERARLHQETLIGLQKEETDAARALLPPWAAAQAQIIGQYNERMQKAQQELDSEIAYFKQVEAQFPQYAQQVNAARLTAEQDYQAKVAAARQLEQAQMQKAAQNMRDELAGKLSSFFQDPLKFFEKQAESAMYKIIANWVMQLGDFQHNPVLQTMFGMGKAIPAPDGSHNATGLSKLMGAGGGHAASAGALSAPATQLSYAGSTLGTAGTVLIAAAGDLSAAASASTMGRGGFGGAGWSGGSTAGGSSFQSVGGGSTGGGLSFPMMGIPGAASGFGGTGASTSSGGGSSFAGAAGTLSQAAKLAAMMPLPGGGSSSGNVFPSANPDEYGRMLASGGGASEGAGMMKLGGGLFSAGMGEYAAVTGAYKQGSEVKGIIGGAASGATIAGPLGAIVGGVGGFVAGMLGMAAQKKAAERYLMDVVEPKMHSAMDRYYNGEESYDQAQRELASLETTEKGNFKKWGHQGALVWEGGGLGAFSTSAALLMQAEKAGRADVPRGTSEFHSGGFVAGFGSGDLGNSEGMAKLKRGEYVMNADAASTYRPMLDALNSGSKTMPMGSAGGSGGAVHLHVHAIDLKDFRGYLRGGGAQEVQAALNSYQGEYAGMADQN
jgi:hypothetical protein